ncbi:MAG: hypothetical protein RL200_914 [Actinomycetota bacterium]
MTGCRANVQDNVSEDWIRRVNRAANEGALHIDRLRRCCEDLRRHDGGIEILSHHCCFWARHFQRRRTDGSDLQLDGGTWVLRQLNGVLLAGIFINHVVTHESIFVDLLGAAGLLGLCLGSLWPFYLIASDGAAYDPNHGGQCPAISFADGVANGASKVASELGAIA